MNSCIKRLSALFVLSSVAFSQNAVIPEECTTEQLAVLGEASGGATSFTECIVAVARISETVANGTIDSVTFQQLCANSGCNATTFTSLDEIPNCSAPIPSADGAEQRNVPVLGLFTSIDTECRNGSLSTNSSTTETTEETDDGDETSGANQLSIISIGASIMLLCIGQFATM